MVSPRAGPSSPSGVFGLFFPCFIESFITADEITKAASAITPALLSVFFLQVPFYWATDSVAREVSRCHLAMWRSVFGVLFLYPVALSHVLNIPFCPLPFVRFSADTQINRRAPAVHRTEPRGEDVPYPIYSDEHMFPALQNSIGFCQC